jgi:hypothetical protein
MTTLTSRISPADSEFLLAKREREQAEAWATLEKYTGRYDGAKWQREALYDRAVFR